MAQGALAQGVDVVGRISAFKSAKVAARPTAGGTYATPTANQPVKNGDGVRTERRGFAQVTFNDKTALRLSELTELIVQDSISLRRLQLAKGAIWIRVTKGSNTSVQTPVATATVRGTEFLMDEKGNLAVREGLVDLEAGGFTIQVGAGEVGGVGPDGKPFKKGVQITTDQQVDVELEGVPESWWGILKSGERRKDNDEWFALLLVPLLFMGDSSGDRSSSVPEPATILILGLGAGAIAARRRKSSK
jgi:hypothetical protein